MRGEKQRAPSGQKTFPGAGGGVDNVFLLTTPGVEDSRCSVYEIYRGYQNDLVEQTQYRTVSKGGNVASSVRGAARNR